MKGNVSATMFKGGATTLHAGAEQHSLGRTAVLHLLPGALLLAWFVVAGPLAEKLGAPALLAILAGIGVVMIPFELGTLLYLGWQRNGKPSLEGVVLYREPIPRWQYALLVPAGLALMVFAFFVVGPPADSYLIERYFSWLPDWFFGFGQNPDVYSQPVLLLVAFLGLLLNGVLGPAVEELYFRGYLLPRLAWLRGWAPVVSGLLFSLYHFFTPWQQLPRLLVLLTLGYVVQWNRNIYWGMIVHCTFNTICMLILLASFLGMASMPM
jgi:membrane protease YdiL (CAAX protease family)